MRFSEPHPRNWLCNFKCKLNLKENSRHGVSHLLARPIFPTIYFLLNFHHAFNNTTCITINLRSGASNQVRWIIRKWFRWLREAALLSITLRILPARVQNYHVKLHRWHRLAYVFRTVGNPMRECYNGGLRLRAMRLWRFSGWIEMSSSPNGTSGHEVMEEISYRNYTL